MNETFILKKNNAKIRKYIMEHGIAVCPCASFDGSCWLDFSVQVNNGVHGVGYYGKDMETESQQESLNMFMAECKNPIVCKGVKEFVNRINDWRNEHDFESR